MVLRIKRRKRIIVLLGQAFHIRYHSMEQVGKKGNQWRRSAKVGHSKLGPDFFSIQHVVIFRGGQNEQEKIEEKDDEDEIYEFMTAKYVEAS